MRKVIEAILFFPSVTKTKMALLMGVTLAAAFFEGFGVAMLFPVIDFIEKGKDFTVLAATSKMWFIIVKTLDLFSIPKTLLSLMIIVFFLLMVRQLFNYLKSIYGTWITESIFSDIRSDGFKCFANADMPFYDSYGVGQLINVLTVDGVRAGGGVFTFFNLLSASTIFVLYFVFLMILSPGMTIFAMAIMGCVGMVLRSRIRRSGEIGVKVSEYNEKISNSIVERLNGIRLLKLASTEEKESNFVKDLSEKIKLNTFDLARIRARMEFMVDPMVILAGLAILYFSVEVFHMTMAKTGMFIFVLLRIMPYTKDIFNSRQALAGFSGSLFRVTDFFRKAKEAHTIKGGRVSIIKLEKGIRFENVSFSYVPGEAPVLENINIFIPAGKMTALVGRSGAGKSTLVDLIPRLRVPTKGRICFDDLAIENYDIRALRRFIAFVSQEGFLFNDTIERNIRYGRPEASPEEVTRAARMAHAHHFIKDMPEEYETVVGERGIKLSGGQRQRIILARALLQEASIIILDEPTSSLDSESEQYIQKAMEEIRKKEKITLIIIAHRLATIRSADQIIVMDKGRVTETGRHKDLVKEASWYAEIVRMQALG
ncbi:MAG: ABC transporter ATP-binding protein [Deltaproteobacteria bacterium]|nr:ABC transporter ATP-binding protein [Deltaproteobacteria bacterium]